MMNWQLPIADPSLDKAWTRMWGRHLLLLLVYLLGFIAWYFRMQGRISDHDIFFWEQRILSRKLLLVMGLHGIAIAIYYRKLWLYQVKRFLLEPLSPNNLALMRILFFAFMVSHQIYYVPDNWAPLAALPATARQPLPMVGWMIEALPISSGLYLAANNLAIILGCLAILGIFTRPAMLALVPLIFYVYGVPQFFGKLSHYQFFFWITLILAATPCYEVWSIDAILHRLRGRRADRKPHFRYALGIRWIMLSLAGVYFFSGFRKLYEAGFYWALSDNPVNLLRTEWLEQFQDVPWVRVDEWPILCSIAASGVILFELAYPFLLLGKRTRLFLALDAVLFHNLNGYFLKIDFVYLKTAHLSFLDWGRLRIRWLHSKRLRAWLFTIAAVAVFGNFVGIFFMFPFLLIGAVIDLSWRAIPRMKRGKWLRNIGSHLPKITSPERHARMQQRWLRWSIVSGALLIGLNATCGAFGIHSWPFSAYPTYSFVRGSTMEYGWFLPTTADGRQLDLDQEAQAAHFRKENILPMSERIVDAWKNKPESLKPVVLTCWLRWETELPALRQAVHVDVVIRNYALDPDLKGKVLSETRVGNLDLRGSEWIFVPSAQNTSQ